MFIWVFLAGIHHVAPRYGKGENKQYIWENERKRKAYSLHDLVRAYLGLRIDTEYMYIDRKQVKFPLTLCVITH